MEDLNNHDSISAQDIQDVKMKALRFDIICIIIYVVIFLLCKSIADFLFYIVGFICFVPFVFSIVVFFYHLIQNDDYWAGLVRNQYKYKRAGFIIKILYKIFGG